jgi:HSP20 family protein
MNEPQQIPVRVYNRDEHIVLAAPLPGLEPDNISIDIAKNRVVIMGEERGPRQHGDDVITDEWAIGPYYREVSLPQDVDGSLTNATYGNGVLVLSMPKCREGEAGSEASFQLHPISATRGERVGHAGREIHPSTTMEHELKHQSEQPFDPKR